MNLLHEFKVGNGVSTKCRCKRAREVFELLQMLAQIRTFDIVDYVQERNGRTGMIDSLHRDQLTWHLKNS